MNNIHPTAVIAENVKLGDNIYIGPYSIIEKDCEIGDDCHIDSHVKIAQYTTLGKGCRIYLGALIGEEPQDHRFKVGTVAYTRLGDNVTIREYVTIHRSPFADGLTEIGDGTLLMGFVHIGHDARLGKHVTVANHTAVSGHVIIEDYAVVSGYVLVHQFARIGKLAMIGGRSLVVQDVPPYCMLTEANSICGPNTVGLRRAGFSNDMRLQIRKAIKIFFFKGLNSSNAVAEIEETLPASEQLAHFISFVKSTQRGIMSGDPELKAIGISGDSSDSKE